MRVLGIAVYPFFSLLILFFVMFTAYLQARNQLVAEVKERQMYLVQLEKKIFTQYIELIKTDVLYLAGLS